MSNKSDNAPESGTKVEPETAPKAKSKTKDEPRPVETPLAPSAGVSAMPSPGSVSENQSKK